MGLFRRLIGRERRAELSTTSGPPTKPVPEATYLPDWSEYWLVTAREQAGVSPYPYPYDTEPPAPAPVGVPDLVGSAPVAPSAGSPDGAAIDGGSAGASEPAVPQPGGHYGVDLTPSDLLPDAVPGPAREGAALTDAEPPPGPPTQLDHSGPAHSDRATGGAWTSAGPAADAVAPSVVDEVPAVSAVLPPPVAASVVLDVPAPEHWGPVGAREPVLTAPNPVEAPEPMSAAAEKLVLDVRDRTEPAVEPAPGQPHVVLGFGDGSTQQLDSDDPDVRTFHALAAALTSAPRHRR